MPLEGNPDKSSVIVYVIKTNEELLIAQKVYDLLGFERQKYRYMKESYGTSSETINGLKDEGYIIDFNLSEGCIVCNEINTALSPDDFVIDKVYRFEGATNPDDESVLYAISSLKFNLKGVLVNGYGISADDATNELISKLKTHTTTVP